MTSVIRILLASAGGRILRPSFGLRTVLLLLVIAFPLFVRAQFRQPTSEELKMTDDPKAPGAAAVYLNVDEIFDDDLHYQSFYVRIKVLQEKGKELATVELPYVKSDTTDYNIPAVLGTDATRIDEVKVRTIHPDGTVIPMTVNPADLLVSKKTSDKGEVQINRKVFTLPSVEVGSILEYSYKLRFDDFVMSSPHWDIQRPYFVHKAHYEFTPSKEFNHGLANYFIDHNGHPINKMVEWQVLPRGVTLNRNLKGQYSLDVSDVPPIPHEDWMPPLQNFRFKVRFDMSAESSSVEYWPIELKHWSAEVDRLAEASPTIKDAVAASIAPGDSDLDKAKKLYKAVQALDNTDFSHGKGEFELKQLNSSQTKRAEATWVQKSGSSEDIAILYLAMLRAAGLSAKPLKITDREMGVFDPAFLSFDQLQDTIVVLDIGGKQIMLDPGEKMCPFQTLHWRHSNASGFMQGSDWKTPSNTPGQSYPDNNTTRRGEITLDSQGGVQGALRFAMIGQQALHWRQIALRNDEDEVKKQFDRWLETTVPAGVNVHIDHFIGLDNPDVTLGAVIKVQGTLGSAMNKRVLLPAYFFETRAHQPFVDEERRQTPVDMHYSEVVNDQVVYHLPAGLTVEGAPQDVKIAWPSHAILTTTTVQAPGQITIGRSLARAFTFALTDQYQDLRGFYQKVAASDQQQLVLTSSPEAKGNQ
ncbi:MAG: DUF3857 domain-containing protein [Terracidiphilus sp.]